MSRLAKLARGAAAGCLMPLARRASAAYVAGDTLDDALRVRQSLAERGLASTVGFWDGPANSPADVAQQYLAGLRSLAGTDGYLSIKLPALGFAKPLVDQISDEAQTLGVRIHFDAMWPDTAEPTRDVVAALARQRAESTAVISVPVAAGGIREHYSEPAKSPRIPSLGYTLPGRWRRSLDDADWAIETGVAVRVVKGQWADLAEPDRDPAAGYLAVIDRLAGRARHVAVATHDPHLAASAISRLVGKGTSCELELLYGLPQEACLRIARRWGVKARVYVPYGAAFLPYALGQMRRRPQILWWLMRDFVRSRFN